MLSYFDFSHTGHVNKLTFSMIKFYGLSFYLLQIILYVETDESR